MFVFLHVPICMPVIHCMIFRHTLCLHGWPFSELVAGGVVALDACPLWWLVEQCIPVLVTTLHLSVKAISLRLFVSQLTTCVWALDMMQMELPLEELPLGWHQVLDLSAIVNAKLQLEPHVLSCLLCTWAPSVMENTSQTLEVPLRGRLGIGLSLNALDLCALEAAASSGQLCT